MDTVSAFIFMPGASMMQNEYDPRPLKHGTAERMAASGSVPAAAELTSRHSCMFAYVDIAENEQNSI